MPTFSLARRLSLSLLCLSLPLIASADDIDQQIDAIRQKVLASSPGDKNNPQAAMVQERALAVLASAQQMIRRGDYENAAQTLDQVTPYLPPNMQADWQKFSKQFTASLEKEKATQIENRQKEATALVEAVRKGCLEAKTSADLDSLFVRCAAAQGERNMGSDALSQRVQEKIMSSGATLQAWAKYLDFRDAGDARAANASLKRLTENNSGIPILKIEEINARYLPVVSDEMNPSAAFLSLATGLKSPADLPALKTKMEAYMATPKNQMVNGVFSSELNRIQGLMNVQDLITKKDYATALTQLSRWNSSGRDDTLSFYEPICTQLRDEIFANILSKWTTRKKAPDEDDQVFIDSVIDELAAKGDYAQIVELLKASETLQRTRPNPPSGNTSTYGERTAIEQFLAAQRFEEAGDYLGAITNYRFVVAAKGPHIPTDKAQAALKSLLEKYPDMAKNQDGLLIQEMQSLRQEMRMLMGRMGAPNRPPFGN